MRKTTTDHNEIRAWAKRRNAHPVELASLIHDGEPAKLGFVFGDPPQAREQLNPISWAQFFAMFQLMDLALAYDGGAQYELLRMDSDLGDVDDRALQA